MKVKFICNTHGNGLWSDVDKPVKIYKLGIACLDVDNGFGELRAYFTKASWNTDKFGLIYTDPNWIKEFRTSLVALGFSPKAAKDADYSEQGMQGDDYVSMDVGKHFINEFFAKGGSI